MNRERVSYAGKKVFIGIDVHRLTYSVACVCEGELVKRCTMEARPEKLMEFLTKYFAGADIATVYEAGFSGFVLHRYVAGNGIKSMVVHAASVEVAARDTVKTDKRDSLKMALQLATGRLRGIAVPSEALEARRLLTRTREQLLGYRQRIMNQLRMKLHQFGLIDLNDRGPMSYVKVFRALKKNRLEELSVVCDSLVVLWRGVNQEMRVLNKKLLAQAAADRFEAVYRSVAGYGPLTARTLANELGDMSQFGNERALFSFTGLTPREFTTGEHRRLGHISRQGSSRLRATLVEAAWRALKLDPALNTDFQRIAHKAGKKRAIVGIARKLIGRARALFRKGEFYAYEIGWNKAA